MTAKLTYIKARYKGIDTVKGYIVGKEYVLQIWDIGEHVHIRDAEDDVHPKICSYANFELFVRSWVPVVHN